MRYPPPVRPKDFERAVAALRKGLRAHFSNRSRAGSKPKFSDVWKRFKNVLAEATNHKCGYCEGPATGQAHGDVEHFAPKGEICVLDADKATWGVEQEHAARVTGRVPRVLHRRGFWWLAYDWENYLLACEICNGAWKLSIFPTLEPLRKPPGPRTRYTPLLLHPFRGRDPAKHLEFNIDGEVRTRAGSAWGDATINTCGLNRPSLLHWRRPIAARVHELLTELATLDTRKPLYRRNLRDIHELGKANRPYSGMVRAIFSSATGKPWSKLEKKFPAGGGTP